MNCSFKASPFLLLIVFLISVNSAFSQKADLNPEDYAQWQSISATSISPDGNWFAYNINLVEGDGWLMLKRTSSSDADEHKFELGIRPEFSNNNQWFAFQITVTEEQQRKLQEQGKPVKLKLGIMNLASAEIDTFHNISSYEFSDDGRFLLMNKYKADEVKTPGTDVIMRNLGAGTNQLIGNAAQTSFNDSGTHLAVLIDAHEKLGNGIHLYNLANNSVQVLESDVAEYKSLTWNDDGNHLAFMKVHENKEYKDPTHHIVAIRNVTGRLNKQVFDPTAIDGFPDDFRVTDFRSLSWSDDNQRMFFGIKEWDKKENGKNAQADSLKKADPDAHLKPTNVEVWHWRDSEVQPRQRVTFNQDQRSNLLSVWHLSDNRFVQLADNHDQDVSLTGDQKHAVIYDPSAHRPAFRESWNDIYIRNVQIGNKNLVIERQEGIQSSPGGKYLLYFRENHWYSYDIARDTHTNLTQSTDSSFDNFLVINGRENNPPFGSGQWDENDGWVLLYDRYDVYKATPTGNVTRITNGASEQIQYRQQRMDWDEPALKSSEPIYLSMFGDVSKNRGYARVDRRNRVETLIYESKSISRIGKADKADKYVYMSQTAVESPNFFMVGSNFRNPVQLTDTNPHQDDYHWADDELITFTNTRGDEMQGRLIYPANYEEGKQYPMMVYIYELRSQSLHTYSLPNRTNAYNQRRYSAEGYFVFEPDINYVIRRPGLSAVENVVPAVEKVLETGMINPDQIGITGHSWGAYQSAFIITQTDMFKAAVAGAPLTNMISMYNSVYWNSGTPDAVIFEVSQGRFPDPYWMDWDNFVDNSPIFNALNINTPLMVMFGTDDGAVDFNQGVEMYNTMRRMEKPYVMLVYDGENHSLRRRENMIDYATRAFEWNEHFIRGAEPASWITDGLPYLKRPEVKN